MADLLCRMTGDHHRSEELYEYYSPEVRSESGLSNLVVLGK